MLARLAVVLTFVVIFTLGVLVGVSVGRSLAAVVILIAGAVVLAGMLIVWVVRCTLVGKRVA